MGKFHGKNGVVKFDGTELLHVTSWTCETSSDVAECTAMGDGWKSYLAGLLSWNVSVEGFEDDTSTFDWSTYITDGDSSETSNVNMFTIELVFDETEGSPQSIYGYAFLTGYGNSENINEAVTNTYTFQGIPDSAGVGPAEDDIQV